MAEGNRDVWNEVYLSPIKDRVSVVGTDLNEASYFGSFGGRGGENAEEDKAEITQQTSGLSMLLQTPPISPIGRREANSPEDINPPESSRRRMAEQTQNVSIVQPQKEEPRRWFSSKTINIIVIISIIVLVIIGVIFAIITSSKGSSSYGDFDLVKKSSNISCYSNTKLIPIFTKGSDWLTFGPPNGSRDPVNNAFDVSGYREFNASVTFNIDDASNSTLILEEYSLIDYCIVYLNGTLVASLPTSGITNVKQGDSISYPYVLSMGQAGDAAAQRAFTDIVPSVSKLPGLNNGQNELKIRYFAIGNGGIYFKITYSNSSS